MYTPPMDSDYRLLAFYPNASQAEMISGLLAGEGIVSMARPAGGLNIPGVYDLGGVEILVPKDELERASQLLEDVIRRSAE